MTERYHLCELAANDMMEASNTLTSQVRMFAITLERDYIDDYFRESRVVKTREKTIETLETNIPEETEAIEALQEAMYYSTHEAGRGGHGI